MRLIDSTGITIVNGDPIGLLDREEYFNFFVTIYAGISLKT